MSSLSKQNKQTWQFSLLKETNLFHSKICFFLQLHRQVILLLWWHHFLPQLHDCSPGCLVDAWRTTADPKWLQFAASHRPTWWIWIYQFFWNASSWPFPVRDKRPIENQVSTLIKRRHPSKAPDIGGSGSDDDEEKNEARRNRTGSWTWWVMSRDLNAVRSYFTAMPPVSLCTSFFFSLSFNSFLWCPWR